MPSKNGYFNAVDGKFIQLAHIMTDTAYQLVLSRFFPMNVKMSYITQILSYAKLYVVYWELGEIKSEIFFPWTYGGIHATAMVCF
jgi:hypothetical protein